MTEENDTTKVETEYAAVIDSHLHIVEGGVEGEDYLITAIGTGKKCVNKYQLVAEVPNIKVMIENGESLEALSAWFEEARDAKLQDIVNMAVKNMFTRPAYDALVDRGTEKEPVEATITEDPKDAKNPYRDYELVADGHSQMQTLLDAYRVGAKKAVGATVKADAKAMRDARKQANELGFASFEEAMKTLAKLQK